MEFGTRADAPAGKKFGFYFRMVLKDNCCISI